MRCECCRWIRENLHDVVVRHDATLVLVGDSPTLVKPAIFCLPSTFAQDAVGRCDTPKDEALAHQERQMADYHVLKELGSTIACSFR